MKLIETFKSSNFNKRRGSDNLKFIILHYTALGSCKEALEHMCNIKNKVSSHFLISKDGKIYYLVDIKNRAWHAGLSYWKGITDMNSSSIGIELDYPGLCNVDKKYSTNQLNALCKLIKILKKTHQIDKKNILGHSDIAPYRKIDPGKNFPWSKLNKAGLAYAPKKGFIKKNKKTKEELEKMDNYKVLKMLNNIGYDTRGIQAGNKKFKLLIEAYQRHYRQSEISGKIDLETLELLKQHNKDLLT
tara:strand:- start:277 stop:1011 length:735 start_codon:yes stop_codon:yes gene_type:complete